MKRNFIVLCLLVAALNALAYPFDVIITKSRDQIQCVILSRTDEQITYRLLDNNQRYTLSTSEVEKVYPRDEEPEILIEPEPETVPAASKKPETLIVEKPTSTTETTSEPTAAPLVEEQKAAKKPKASSETDLQFKLFMSTLNGPSIEDYRAQQTEKAQKKEIVHQNIISVFVTGLEENQADIQKIIESEILSKLGSIKGYKAKVEIAQKGISEDSLIVIAKDSLYKYTLLINALPFQNQYYLQSKLVNTSNGEHLVSNRTTSSLMSLEDVLKVAEELTNPVIKHFQKQEEDEELKAWIEESDRQKVKQEEGESGIIDNTFTLVIVNPKNYVCRVVIAGCIVGLVNPLATQSFKVSVNLYGKVQIIQNFGTTLPLSESTYYIPKQSRNAVLTLTKD